MTGGEPTRPASSARGSRKSWKKVTEQPRLRALTGVSGAATRTAIAIATETETATMMMTTGRPRRREQHEGMSTGLKVGLILGASILLIGLIVGGIIMLANSGSQPVAVVKPPPPVINPIVKPPVNPPGNPPPGNGLWTTNYTVNLTPQRNEIRTFQFKANTRYELTAQGSQFNSDFDFAVMDVVGDLEFATSVGQTARLSFNPPTAGSYRVEVHNQSPAMTDRITVTIREIGPEQAVEAAHRSAGQSAQPPACQAACQAAVQSAV